jgi:signal transduction histidine kinase
MERQATAVDLNALACRVFSGLTVVLAVAVAAQRHQFSSPGLALAPLLMAVVPWIAIGFGITKLFKEGSTSEAVFIAGLSVLTIAATYWLVIGFPIHQSDYAPFFAVILVTFVTATNGVWFGGAAIAGCLGCSIAFDAAGHYPLRSWFVWCFGYGIGWLGGGGFRMQVQLSRQLADAQAELAGRSAEAERHRLARDVHDLIAHSLAVSMLHLTGARLALKAGDRDEALEALEEAEASGRSAMSEIHRTVGLLGSGQADVAAPTPTGSDIPRLLESFRAAGLVLEVSVSGHLDRLSLAEGLAAYRIVQESLANAVKHCPGATVQVRAKVGLDRAVIRVANPLVAPVGSGYPARGPGSGNGLKGMSERVTALGGTLSARNCEGFWTVDAVIPIASART